MQNVSMIVNFSTVKENASLTKIYELIKNPDSIYRNTVEEIRRLYKIGSVEAADELKKALPGFTVTGIFNKRRKNDTLLSYSGMLILDLDDLMPAELQQIKEIVKDIPYTHMSFTSPSGFGLKIIAKVDSSSDAHKTAYEQVKAYYQKEVGKKFDATSDLARLCFVSYDRDAFYNSESAVFKTNAIKDNKLTVVKAQCLIHNTDEKHIDGLFDKAVRLTERKIKFEKGNRNNFIFSLANNCNKYGLSLESILNNCLNTYSDGWNDIELKSVITGVYNRNGNEFGLWKNIVDKHSHGSNNENNDTYEENEAEFVEHKKTPTIPVRLIEEMPSIIREVALMFKEPRERDVFITGMLSVLSGIMFNVKGIYDGDLVFPNLFVFVIAPAASGKGNMKIAKQIADDFHNKMVAESLLLMERYKIELDEYNEAKKRKEKTGEKPVEPPFKMLFVPGNSSSAAIYEHLRDTDGIGIVFETEADTISGTLKNDWANYSDLLRRAFHHESLTSKRKTNKEYIEIKLPKLSMALSGTNDQVSRLIHSAENGLFSRFLFYQYHELRSWKDVSPSNGKYNFPTKVIEKGADYTKMAEFLRANPTNFSLSEKQWTELNRVFSMQLNNTACFVGEEAGASIIRLGIITFRLAMIFSAIKKYEDKNKEENVVCTDAQFKIAFELMQIYLVHTMAVYGNLPTKRKSLDPKMQVFLDKLPISFERKDAIIAANQNGLKLADSTVDKYLRRLIEYKYLEKDIIEYNSYRKTICDEVNGNCKNENEINVARKAA